ncbi:MAG: 4-hydroxy-tetrahydrodipicolinate synthase [bacterium]
MFKGSIVALVTPFSRGKLDETALRRLVEFHVKSGTDAVSPCGTTGESPTLTHEEHHRVVEVVIEQALGRVPVIAGTGSNSTAEAISLTRHAKDAGADAALMIAPYYNRPTQRGLFEHFRAVARKADIPIILYNHQGRTGVTLQPETIRALTEVGRFVAVKDASGGVEYASRVLELCEGKVGVLSGNDPWTLPLLSLGGSGVISVIANIAPGDMGNMVREYLGGNAKKARRLHYRMVPLMRALELEVNPVPVKTAMGMMGMISPGVRPPLSGMSAKNRRRLRGALRGYGLVK